ncbi:MAG: DUF2066 domain-containing protein [Gammaproteobacteria bacterium]|nr:DUF2066 domain-containing protein [Gammaproteobacteria bacterium]MCD8542156.1 DUF2066 domain-containing protein [Gammaproteobacteria bacterium]
MWYKLTSLILAIFFVLPAFGNAVDIYQVNLPVNTESQEERAKVFSEAAQVLFERLDPHRYTVDLSDLLQHPEQYISSFSYLSDPEQPEKLTIRINFDPHTLPLSGVLDKASQSYYVMIHIRGVDSVKSFNEVLAYFSEANGVKSAMIEEVNNHSLILKVVVDYKHLDVFQKALFSQHLSVIGSEDLQLTSPALFFQWSA